MASHPAANAMAPWIKAYSPSVDAWMCHAQLARNRQSFDLEAFCNFKVWPDASPHSGSAPFDRKHGCA